MIVSCQLTPLRPSPKCYGEKLLHSGILLHAVKFYNECEIYKASCSSLINSTTEYIDSNTRSPTHCHKIFCFEISSIESQNISLHRCHCIQHIYRLFRTYRFLEHIAL